MIPPEVSIRPEDEMWLSRLLLRLRPVLADLPPPADTRPPPRGWETLENVR